MAFNPSSVPIDIPDITGWNHTYIGNGIVKYYPVGQPIEMTGSAVTTPFIVQYSHRLMRVEEELLTSSSAPDTSGNQTQVKKHIKSGYALKIADTGNQTGTGSDSQIIVFGIGWEEEGMWYDIVNTGANDDDCYLNVYVQYINDDFYKSV